LFSDYLKKNKKNNKKNRLSEPKHIIARITRNNKGKKRENILKFRAVHIIAQMRKTRKRISGAITQAYNSQDDK